MAGPLRTVRRTCTLDAPADVVWRALGSPAALVHVAAPLLRLPALERRRRPWQQGETVTTWLLVLGVLPVSRHTVVVQVLDDAAMSARTEEHGGPVRVWRHGITVEPAGTDRCRYTDEIEIGAGALTGPVSGLAAGFFRWRQHRWRRLAPVLAAAVRA
jgi:ligand-binding SRPBCC domain-containing protein